MHCYKCEKELEVTAGAEDFPVYDMSKKGYRNEMAIFLECPYCRELIGIINYTSQEIEMIVIDERLKI